MDTPLKGKLKHKKKAFLPKIKYDFSADREIVKSMKQVEEVINRNNLKGSQLSSGIQSPEIRSPRDS